MVTTMFAGTLDNFQNQSGSFPKAEVLQELNTLAIIKMKFRVPKE
jgi:hypothetical protein